MIKIPYGESDFKKLIEKIFFYQDRTHFIPDAIQQAENQLNTYMNTERFKRPDVCGFYVIFLGGKVHQWREYGTY